MHNEKTIPVEKKPYSAPQLTVHGDVEKLTLETKGYGPSDGYLLEGNPIAWVS